MSANSRRCIVSCRSQVVAKQVLAYLHKFRDPAGLVSPWHYDLHVDKDMHVITLTRQVAQATQDLIKIAATAYMNGLEDTLNAFLNHAVTDSALFGVKVRL